MQGNNLLEQYEQVSYIVEQMLISALDENWDLLLSWQTKYLQLSENIMLVDDFAAIENMPLQHQGIVRMYIKNILSYQQQLTQLIIARHTQLRGLIGKHIDYHNKVGNYQKIASLV
ncbi:hypothetical protein A9G43_02290 [Gilliamella sp. Occ3-1]|uniref:hypothetical protein n=1 Tax=Gilliamella sp. Occ3-1 TaxID=3120253 RepID=UPI00080DE43F|nr:hypothetical protein [Gilliamella apicola]OCG72148.1 hypothetical protein A9G43_02290 [Gilliamella apicola]